MRVNQLAPAELVSTMVQGDEYGAGRFAQAHNESIASATDATCSALGSTDSVNFKVVAAQTPVSSIKSPSKPGAGDLLGRPPAGKKVAYPDTLVEDRFAHQPPHGQTFGGARLGGLGESRPKRLLGQPGDDADSTSDSVSSYREPGAGQQGDRHRVDRNRRCSQERRRGKVCGILPATVQGDAACRPADHRQHVAGVRPNCAISNR